MFFQKALSLVMAFFTLVFSGTLLKKEGQYFFRFTDDITFDTIAADEAAITDEERSLCREWYEKNILLADGGETPAFGFRTGGKALSGELSEWDIVVSEESGTGEVRRGGKTTVMTLTNDKKGVRAEVEATIYEENATVEWYVRLKTYPIKIRPSSRISAPLTAFSRCRTRSFTALAEATILQMISRS